METAATLEQRNEPGLGLEGSGLDLSFFVRLGRWLGPKNQLSWSKVLKSGLDLLVNLQRLEQP